jgi:hypothetical protein
MDPIPDEFKGKKAPKHVKIVSFAQVRFCGVPWLAINHLSCCSEARGRVHARSQQGRGIQGAEVRPESSGDFVLTRRCAQVVALLGQDEDTACCTTHSGLGTLSAAIQPIVSNKVLAELPVIRVTSILDVQAELLVPGTSSPEEYNAALEKATSDKSEVGQKCVSRAFLLAPSSSRSLQMQGVLGELCCCFRHLPAGEEDATEAGHLAIQHFGERIFTTPDAPFQRCCSSDSERLLLAVLHHQHDC